MKIPEKSYTFSPRHAELVSSSLGDSNNSVVEKTLKQVQGDVLVSGFNCFGQIRSLLLLTVLFLPMILGSCRHSGKKLSDEKETESFQTRVAVEFILENEETKSSLLNSLKEIPMECYAWKNHVVLFGNAKDTLGLANLVQQSGIKTKIKRYHDPLYVFDKTIHCSDKTIKKHWRNYLLTANLVEDTALQQQYVDYHNRQFEEWPEVAQGFCNAGFQQLLVYRNGRQLLLVISVPADKTLDELDPKTVENNPRMVEWNTIMSTFQEGIEGTGPGETWVFLDKVE